jgi:DNA-binding XRE family transcriptional regulator/molybdate-binding protein
MRPGQAVRERRLQCGLTQGQLAARAGVSRQLVAAVEAGRNTPAVDAALRIARALGTTVEDVFAVQAPAAIAAVGDRLPERVPLRVGRVGERLVAAPLPDHGAAGAGWARPDGVCERGQLRLFAGASPEGLVLAGCDPAFGLAERMLEGLGARSLITISVATGTALEALERGSIHAAVVHGRERELPAAPVPVRRLHVARWQVGVAAAAPPASGRTSLEALVRSGAPIVRRDPAAASQQAFERALRRLGIAPPTGGPEAFGHLDAARTAAALGGVAVTTEAAARAFGLRFLALEQHVVQLWIAERWLDHPGAAALGDLLASRAFAERVAHYGGYDLEGCGTPA